MPSLLPAPAQPLPVLSTSPPQSVSPSEVESLVSSPAAMDTDVEGSHAGSVVSAVSVVDGAPPQAVGWCPPAVPQADQAHLMDVLLRQVASLAEELAQLRQHLPLVPAPLPTPRHAE